MDDSIFEKFKDAGELKFTLQLTITILMKLLESTNIQNITRKPTIFICGENEKLKIDVLVLLIELKTEGRLECLYFISPTDDLRNYLKTVLSEGEDYQIIERISKVPNFRTKNVIACGIGFPFSEDFEFLKKSKENQILIFFKEMGIFRGGLEQKHRNIIFVEQTFEDFTENYIQSRTNPEPTIDIARKSTFENRGREKDEHINFMSSSQRVAKIVGLVGFGKKSFMDEIRVRFPKRNYFQFVFTDKSNDHTDILLKLMTDLNVKFDERALAKTKLTGNHVPAELRSFFQAFDKGSNALIFYNVEEIYDFRNRRFYKQQVEALFKFLINRETYKSNKIYLLSVNDFDLLNRDLVKTFFINPMEPHYIKLIAAQEFINLGENELAQAARNLTDEAVENLICGHPYIAKRFVDASREVGMTQILTDPAFQRYFETAYKIQYINDELLKKSPISDEEKMLLGYLALFKDKVEMDFLAQLTTTVPQVVSSLQKRFFLEVKHFANASAKHYVPRLIQSYVVNQLAPEKLRSNHTQIGDFFWGKAERFGTSDAEVMEAYRMALYHYTEAHNKEKEKNLALRFKEKFLDRAQELYFQKRHGEAWDYYTMLFEMQALADAMHLMFYAISNSKLNKTGTEQIFDLAVAADPRDVRVKNAYTQFCYDQKDYKKAEALYFEVIEIYPSDFVAHNLYAKVLAQTNREPEAISLLERLISEFERIPKPTDGERKNLITSYMTYRSILEVDGRYEFFEKSIFNLLVKDGFRQDSVKEMFVSAEAVQVVKDRYQRLLNVRSLGTRLKRRYDDAFAKAVPADDQGFQKLSASCVTRNERESILSSISEFEKQAEFSQQLITKALRLNPYEFTALVSDFYLQIARGKLSSLKHLVENFYSQNVVENFVKLQSEYGNMKGSYFEQILKELLRHIYPVADIQSGQKIKNEAGEGYEYDFIVTNSATREIIVIEAKGFESKKQIPLGVFSTEGQKFESETVKWFFNHTFPFFKRNYPNPQNYQFKACYITSAGFTEEALRHLTSQYGNAEMPHKEKPSELDMYYSGKELSEILSRKGLTQELNKLKRYWDRNG